MHSTFAASPLPTLRGEELAEARCFDRAERDRPEWSRGNEIRYMNRNGAALGEIV